MGTSAVATCNLALANIGHQPFITSLTQNSREAILCNQQYTATRNSMLRQYLWRFARRRASLVALAQNPAFDGGTYFALPVDCLRAVGPDQDYRYSYGEWQIEGNKILAGNGTFNLVYIASVDESLEDPIFTEALAANIGKKIAMPLTKEVAIKQDMDAEYTKLVKKAAFVGATEIDSEVFISEAFISQHY